MASCGTAGPETHKYAKPPASGRPGRPMAPSSSRFIVLRLFMSGTSAVAADATQARDAARERRVGTAARRALVLASIVVRVSRSAMVWISIRRFDHSNVSLSSVVRDVERSRPRSPLGVAPASERPPPPVALWGVCCCCERFLPSTRRRRCALFSKACRSRLRPGARLGARDLHGSACRMALRSAAVLRASHCDSDCSEGRREQRRDVLRRRLWLELRPV